MGTLMLRCLCGIISGRKPVEEKQWPDSQKSCHVTEYGLDPQIIERLKCKNLITNMENVRKY